VTHLPLHVQEEGAALVLLGHVAKPNPHWRHLQARPQAVVTFMGPHAYMSPSVYPDLARVPTWNYLAVHCTVQATLVESAEAKDGLLKKLIGDHEPAYAAQWRSLGQDYAHKMLAGIVAFELQVTALQCKLKLNQHRPEAHAHSRPSTCKATRTSGTPAGWINWGWRLGHARSLWCLESGRGGDRGNSGEEAAGRRACRRAGRAFGNRRGGAAGRRNSRSAVPAGGSGRHAANRPDEK
jgi:transcriptional regulator